MNLKEYEHSETGFSMVEVLISLVVLMIGIAGILTIQISAVRASAVTTHQMQAIIHAEDKMEELLSIPSAELIDDSDTVIGDGFSTSVNATPGVPAPALGIEFTRTWDIIETGSTGSGTTALIELTVSWLERGNDPYTFTLTGERRFCVGC